MIQDRSLRRAMALATIVLALGGTSAAAQQLPPGHMPVPASQAQSALSTVVLETMTSAGYTYVRGEMDGEEAWFAGPQTTLAVGDTVQVTEPMLMQNFASRSLGRSFETLYFVGAYLKGSATAATASGASFGPEGEVREVLASGGYTYLRVETEAESLWIAGPSTQVGEGDVVSWRAGSMMRDFSSRTLGRTFDEILFVQEIAVVR